MWKLAGPTASTLATTTARWPAARAARALAVKSSRSVAVVASSIPAARAMPARSDPVEVAVGNPPTDSRLSLSNTRWARFGGAYRAIVVNVPRFIRTDPSPSMTTTFRSG